MPYTYLWSQNAQQDKSLTCSMRPFALYTPAWPPAEGRRSFSIQSNRPLRKPKRPACCSDSRSHGALFFSSCCWVSSFLWHTPLWSEFVFSCWCLMWGEKRHSLKKGTALLDRWNSSFIGDQGPDKQRNTCCKYQRATKRANQLC